MCARDVFNMVDLSGSLDFGVSMRRGFLAGTQHTAFTTYPSLPVLSLFTHTFTECEPAGYILMCSFKSCSPS